MLRYVLVFALAGASVVGCGDGPPNSPLSAKSTVMTLTAEKPLVVKLKPSSSLTTALKDLEKNELRLTVHGMTAPPKAEVRVRVFLNTPDATDATGKEAPGFVGNINFSHDPEAAVDFSLDPTRAFQKLLREKPSLEEFSVTLVLTPLRPTNTVPEDTKVKLIGVSIETVEKTEK